jgi:hypothetical protein
VSVAGKPASLVLPAALVLTKPVGGYSKTVVNEDGTLQAADTITATGSTEVLNAAGTVTSTTDEKDGGGSGFCFAGAMGGAGHAGAAVAGLLALAVLAFRRR